MDLPWCTKDLRLLSSFNAAVAGLHHHSLVSGRQASDPNMASVLAQSPDHCNWLTRPNSKSLLQIKTSFGHVFIWSNCPPKLRGFDFKANLKSSPCRSSRPLLDPGPVGARCCKCRLESRKPRCVGRVGISSRMACGL